MPNRPEYMAVWIGITSAGGVAALINTNLIGTALAHCIDIVTPKHIVVAAELAGELRHARGRCSRPAPKIWSLWRERGISSRSSIARSTPCPAHARLPPSAPR